MGWGSFGGRKSEYTLGLDIGTSSVKVVELLHSGTEISLNNYAQFHAKINYVTARSGSFNILDTEVANILERMFSAAEFHERVGFMALPVFSSFSTILEIPFIEDDRLDQVIEFEARKFIPMPIKDVQIDSVKLEHLSGSEKIRALVVAVPREIVERYQKIAELINFDLVNMELETYSLARALFAGVENEPVLILDIGARTTNMSIVDSGVIVTHHNIDMGGASFTRAIARGMGLEAERAEEMKKEEGLVDPSGQITQLLAPSVDKIILEIEQVIDEYVNEGGRGAEKLLITGGGSLLPGLLEYLGKSVRIKIESGDSLRNVKVLPELRPVLEKSSPMFSVALGLALRKE